MADTMQFDLVSPERRLASGDATEVMIPGDEGDMVAMPDHSPVITTLRPGLVRAMIGGQAQEFLVTGGFQEFLVTGGFAEINAEAASVLAEHALPRDEVTQDMINELVAGVRKEIDEATDQRETDLLNKRLGDLAAAASAMGLSA